MADAGDEGDSSATEMLVGREREFTHRRFQLKVVEGPDAGLECVSVGSEIGIGTSIGNQLILTDGTVSRHHCSLATTARRGVFLRDLGSTNGTRLGGYRVDAAYLKPGAVIEVGMTKVRFDPVGDVVREPLSAEDRWGRLLGASGAMRRIFALVSRIAQSDSTILLQGETGTGKGLLADAIHASSPRARAPFVVLDCGSIAPTLIESELFGHERGSFTGAHASRAGAFEAAQTGTLFLDEVGELPIDMQPKLLRALEERVIKRVGSTVPIRLDVRVIAATNRELRREVNRGSFRPDLYFRLNTVTITIPPLRERREDIPLLVSHFYEQFSGGGVAPPELMESLGRRDWPGNVRELRSAVERATLLGNSSSQSMLPPPGSERAPALSTHWDPAISFRQAKETAIACWERAYLRELLEQNGGNISRAARAARTDRNYLRELLRKHQVQARDD